VTEVLGALLATADPRDLLPRRRAEEAAQIRTPLRIRGSARLGDERAYLLLEDGRGVVYGVPAAVDSGRLLRASAGWGASEALIAAMAAGRSELDGLQLTTFHAQAASGERAIDVDQTNELVVVGGVAVVKWLLHPVAGEQPAVRRLAALERAGFTGTPRTWGLVYLEAGGERVLVATVSAYVPDAEDGWDWAVNEVRELARGLRTDALQSVRDVGGLIGRMHVALAGAGLRTAAEADARQWLEQARVDAAAAALGRVDARVVEARLGPIGECAGTPTMYVHGDLHIGQVLRAGTPPGYFVIDFDGNPTQSAGERIERQPAARDVAGMLASLDHVGRVVLRRTEGLDPEAKERVLAWIEDAQREFLHAYVEAIGEGGHPEVLDRSLLDAMQVQQECREYVYAARYLPHWRYVPDAALPALLARTHDADSERT